MLGPPRAGFRPVRRLGPWLLIPLLAVIAYGPALGIGFLSDDFVLLTQSRQDVGFSRLLPDSGWFFYRPVGTLLTWDLGGRWWGMDPGPYHLVSLALHAVTALALAGGVSVATGRRGPGLLAGALFAVFPLHLEAVGWTAAQWDLWAAAFGLGGLWAFTAWWRAGRGPGAYLLALLGYALGLFSKESLLAFLPLYGLAAWLARPPTTRRDWGRLGLALLPFAAVLAANVAVRLATWGRLGGYPTADPNLGASFWDHLAGYGRWLLAPLNPAQVSASVIQGVLMSASLGWLLGLVWYGHRQRRVLAVVGAWVALALLPALNLDLRPDNGENNRFLYLAAAGYCAGVAALLEPLLAAGARAGPRAARAAGLGLGVLLLASAATAWLQLEPWHAATRQARALQQDLRALLPPQPSATQPVIWYGAGIPDNYRGAFVYRLGLDAARFLETGEMPALEPVRDVLAAPLAAAPGDAFALRFNFIRRLGLFQVDYLAGISAAADPPLAAEAGPGYVLWDFRACAPGTVGAWQPVAAAITCVPGAGLRITPQGADAQLIGPPLDPAPPAAARYTRIRVAAQYDAQATPETLQQWYWHGPQDDWSEERLRNLPVRPGDRPHVYWLALPAAATGPALTRLRYDPVSAPLPVTVAWIALDLVP
jgi:hypothetical protein